MQSNNKIKMKYNVNKTNIVERSVYLLFVPPNNIIVLFLVIQK